MGFDGDQAFARVVRSLKARSVAPRNKITGIRVVRNPRPAPKGYDNTVMRTRPRRRCGRASEQTPIALIFGGRDSVIRYSMAEVVRASQQVSWY